MVMRAMVTVVVEAVIGVTMANGDGYNGYAGEGDSWERDGYDGGNDGDGIALGDGFYGIVTVVTKVYTY
jgi:hypothetical protein